MLGDSDEIFYEMALTMVEELGDADLTLVDADLEVVRHLPQCGPGRWLMSEA